MNDQSNNQDFRMFIMVKYTSHLPPGLKSYSTAMIACNHSVEQIDVEVRAAVER